MRDSFAIKTKLTVKREEDTRLYEKYMAGCAMFAAFAVRAKKQKPKIWQR